MSDVAVEWVGKVDQRKLTVFGGKIRLSILIGPRPEVTLSSFVDDTITVKT